MEAPGSPGWAREEADATRRTYLANERTYLAWWRTGLTSFAVALGAGKLLPELTGEGDAWTYATIGGGFAAIGVVCIVYGSRRVREVDEAVRAGGFVPLDRRLVIALSVAGVLLGALTVLVVVGVV